MMRDDLSARKNGGNTGSHNPKDTRFKPGNPGRPKGARNKATLAVEALLDGEAEALSRKALELAGSGDAAMVRFCFDRIAPPRKDRPVSFTLAPLVTAKDAVSASAALLEAVARGDLTPMEAGELSKLVANHIEALKAYDFEERLAKIEARTTA